MRRKDIQQKLRRMGQQARSARIQGIDRRVSRAIYGTSPLRTAYPLVQKYLAWESHIKATPLADLERVIAATFGVPEGMIGFTPAGNKDAAERQDAILHDKVAVKRGNDERR